MTPRTSAFLLAAGMASCTLSAGTLTDLGLLPGGTYAFGNAISGDGTAIVGYADTGSGDRAFRWTSAGMNNLGTLSGHVVSEANGISANGLVVVGRSFSVSNASRAFRWASGSMTDWASFRAAPIRTPEASRPMARWSSVCQAPRTAIGPSAGPPPAAWPTLAP